MRTTRAPRKRTASAQWWHRVHAQRGAAKGVAWQFAGQARCVRSRALSRSQASHWLLNFVRQSWRTTGTAAECKDHGVHVFRLYRSQLNSCAVSIGCSNSLPVKALLFPRIVALFFCFNSLCEIQNFQQNLASLPTPTHMLAQLWYGHDNNKCSDLCDCLVYLG